MKIGYFILALASIISVCIATDAQSEEILDFDQDVDVSKHTKFSNWSWLWALG